MSARHPRRVAMAASRHAAAVMALTVTAALALVPARPAEAFSVYCGVTAIGVGNNYVVGLDNGHPADEHSTLDGWNGKEAERTAGAVAFALERTVGAMEIGIDIFDTAGFDVYLGGIGQKVAKLAAVIAKTAVEVSKEAADITLMTIAQRNARVDACGGLVADMTDALFLAMLEEELAYLDMDGTATNSYGQVPGSRRVPTALFLLPQDGTPAWQRDGNLYGDRGNHADLGIIYLDGALNAPYIGVAETVRNQIAYLDASGIDVGDAGEQWIDAMAVLRGGDLRTAYQLLARAYRTAVTQVPDPGQPASPGGGDGNPWDNSGQPTQSPAPSPSPTGWPG